MSRRSDAVIRSLRILFSEGTHCGLNDADLLHRFVDRADGSDAFEGLVLRHGPMVFDVCLRVLGDPHDAQDAFQATFLVLAARARSIHRQDSLGSWLHGVALRVARRARRTPLAVASTNVGPPNGTAARPRPSPRPTPPTSRPCTRRSAACPRSTARPWSSATWRA